MTELDNRGCPWRPIDIWALAQPSLNLYIHSFRWKWSWSDPLARSQTKIGGTLGSRFLEAAPGGQLIFGRYLTLMNTPFSFQIWIEDGLGSNLRPHTLGINQKMTELETKYQLASRDSLYLWPMGDVGLHWDFWRKRLIILLLVFDF